MANASIGAIANLVIECAFNSLNYKHSQF